MNYVLNKHVRCLCYISSALSEYKTCVSATRLLWCCHNNCLWTVPLHECWTITDKVDSSKSKDLKSNTNTQTKLEKLKINLDNILVNKSTNACMYKLSLTKSIMLPWCQSIQELFGLENQWRTVTVSYHYFNNPSPTPAMLHTEWCVSEQYITHGCQLALPADSELCDDDRNFQLPGRQLRQQVFHPAVCTISICLCIDTSCYVQCPQTLTNRMPLKG